MQVEFNKEIKTLKKSQTEIKFKMKHSGIKKKKMKTKMAEAANRTLRNLRPIGLQRVMQQ